MRTPPEARRQAQARSGQDGAQDVIGQVPFSKMAAIKQVKDRRGILSDEVSAPDIIIQPMGAQLADAGGIATAIAVGPKVTIDGQAGNPALGDRSVILDIGLDEIVGTPK